MAGSASNWFKPQAGPRKGQAVYLSKAQQTQVAQAFGAPPHAGRSLAARTLERTGSMTSLASRLAQQLANTSRPSGVAQSGGARPFAALGQSMRFTSVGGKASTGKVTHLAANGTHAVVTDGPLYAVVDAQGRQVGSGYRTRKRAIAVADGGGARPTKTTAASAPATTSPVPTTPASASTTPAIPTGFPHDPLALPVVNASPGGSTGAVIVRDRTGQDYLRKQGTPQRAEHLREEATADAIYRVLGIPVAQSTLYETSAGPVKLSRMLPGVETVDAVNGARGRDKQARQALRDGMVADALLANWDVNGMTGKNILRSGGTVYRIDNGGALRFSARGAPKGAGFGPAPMEIWSFRDPAGRNSDLAKVHGRMTIYDLVPQMRAVASKRDAILSAATDGARDTLGKRIDNLAYIADVASRLQGRGADAAKADAYLRGVMYRHHKGGPRPSVDDAVRAYKES